MSIEVSPGQAGQYTHANGIDVYYEDYGSGQPLVLIHGGLGIAADLAPQAAVFSKYFRVLVPDSRGHGRTNNPTGAPLSYRLMADDLAAFIAALGLQKPLVGGVSDGGQLTLELGMRHPGLARALVVVAAWFSFSEQHLLSLAQDLGFEAPGRVDFARAEKVLPAEAMRTRHGQSPDHWHTLLVQSSRLWLTPLNYTVEDIGQVSAPTLIVIGDRDDLIPVDEAVAMRRAIPSSELAVIPNAGHSSLMQQRPEIFTTVVLDFLMRQNPGREAEVTS